MLDAAMGGAVHSTLEAGYGYTTVEIKVNYVRALMAETGPSDEEFDVNDDEKQIVQTYKNYLQDFRTLEPSAIVPYYHTPCLWISATEISVMTLPAEIETRFARMMRRLKKLDYARSDLAELQVTRLDETVALLRVRGTRIKTDGSLLEPFAATYTLRKTPDGWKMVVLALHGPTRATLPTDNPNSLG